MENPYKTEFAKTSPKEIKDTQKEISMLDSKRVLFSEMRMWQKNLRTPQEGQTQASLCVRTDAEILIKMSKPKPIGEAASQDQ